MKTTTEKKIKSWDYAIYLTIGLEDKLSKTLDLFRIKKPVFTASALVYYKGREEMAGQCLDEVNEILEKNWDLTKERATIYYLWKKHHLNDTHAGTKKQENRLHQNGIENRATNYEKACEALEKAGLLVDDGVKFGASWNYWEIPAEDLAEIKKFFIWLRP